MHFVTLGIIPDIAHAKLVNVADGGIDVSQDLLCGSQ